MVAATALIAAVLLLAVPAAASVPLGARDGGIEWFRHVFPVRGPHGERGPVGEFGAPRDGGRIHEGFDILAACGTELRGSARWGRPATPARSAASSTSRST
jgi:hypothetical protein